MTDNATPSQEKCPHHVMMQTITHKNGGIAGRPVDYRFLCEWCGLSTDGYGTKEIAEFHWNKLVTPTALCCQKCSKPGLFALSGLCDDCEIEEIQEEMMDNWIEPTDMGAQ